MEKLVSPPPQRYTFEEYLHLEQNSAEKHEYRHGEIISMAGGSENHSLITTNVIGELRNRIKGMPCRVYDSNLRVRIARKVRYCYPDVFVICNQTQFDEDDRSRTTITNPRVVIEVLSPSTEYADRGEKFSRYIQIESLEEYILVSQHKPRMETFLRQGDGTWSFAYFDGSAIIARVRSLGVDLPLADIYAGVTFPPDNEDSVENPTV